MNWLYTNLGTQEEEVETMGKATIIVTNIMEGGLVMEQDGT